MKLKILLAVGILLAFTSCKVTWVPTKSDTALNLIQKVQNDANNAFGLATYNDVAYGIAGQSIDSLISFDKSRVKSGTILKQDDRIKQLFDEFEKEHKAKGSIVASERDTYTTYLKSAIDAREISENSLK
jgi:hypothetical protein